MFAAHCDLIRVAPNTGSGRVIDGSVLATRELPRPGTWGVWVTASACPRPTRDSPPVGTGRPHRNLKVPRVVRRLSQAKRQGPPAL